MHLLFPLPLLLPLLSSLALAHPSPPKVPGEQPPPSPLQRRDARNDERSPHNDPSRPSPNLASNPMNHFLNSPFTPIAVPAPNLVPSLTHTPNPRYFPGGGIRLPLRHPSRGHEDGHSAESPRLQKRDAMKDPHHNGPGRPDQLPPWQPNYLPPGHPYLNGPGAPLPATTTTSRSAKFRPVQSRLASLLGEAYMDPYPPAAAHQPWSVRRRDAGRRLDNPDPYADGPNADYPAVNYPVHHSPENSINDDPTHADPGPSMTPNDMFPRVRYPAQFPPRFPVRWGPGPPRHFVNAMLTASPPAVMPTPLVVKRDAKDFWDGPGRLGSVPGAGGSDPYYLPPAHPYLNGPGAPLPEQPSTTAMISATPRTRGRGRVRATPPPSRPVHERDAESELDPLQERDAKHDGNRNSQYYVRPGYPGNYLPPGDHPYFNDRAHSGTTSTTAAPRQTRSSFFPLLQGPPNLPLQERATLESPNPFWQAFGGPVNDQFGDRPQRGAPAHLGTTTISTTTRGGATPPPAYPLQKREADLKEYDPTHYEQLPATTTATWSVPSVNPPRISPYVHRINRLRGKRDADAGVGANAYAYQLRGHINKEYYRNRAQHGAPMNSGTTTISVVARVSSPPNLPIQERDPKDYNPSAPNRTPPARIHTTTSSGRPIFTLPSFEPSSGCPFYKRETHSPALQESHPPTLAERDAKHFNGYLNNPGTSTAPAVGQQTPAPPSRQTPERPWEQLYWEGETFRAPRARTSPDASQPSDLSRPGALAERDAKHFEYPVNPPPAPPQGYTPRRAAGAAHPSTTTMISAAGGAQPTPPPSLSPASPPQGLRMYVMREGQLHLLNRDEEDSEAYPLPPSPQQPRPYVPRGSRLHAQIHGEEGAPGHPFQKRDAKQHFSHHPGTSTIHAPPVVVQHTPTPLSRLRPEGRPWGGEVPTAPRSTLLHGGRGYFRPSGAGRAPRAHADAPNPHADTPPSSPTLGRRDAMDEGKGGVEPFNNGPGRPQGFPVGHPGYLEPGHPYSNGPGAPVPSVHGFAHAQPGGNTTAAGERQTPPSPPSSPKRQGSGGSGGREGKAYMPQQPRPAVQREWRDDAAQKQREKIEWEMEWRKHSGGWY